MLETSFAFLSQPTYEDRIRSNGYHIRERCDDIKECFIKSTLLDGDKRICYPEKYIPGGNIQTVEEIDAPIATLTKGFLGYVKKGGKALGDAGKIAKLAKSVETAGKIFKAASKMAPIIGAFSGILGFIGKTPSARDAIKATRKAIKKLTSDINHRLDSMGLYVDQKILDSDRKWTVRKYEELFNKWSGCMSIEVTATGVNNCQHNAFKDIWASRSHFMRYHEKEGKQLERNELKELEVTLYSLREYTTLLLMALRSLSESYKQEKGATAVLRYRTYLKQTYYISESIAKYTTWAFNQIISFYDKDIKRSCLDSFKCDPVKTNTYDAYSTCSCKMRPDVFKSQLCGYNVKVHIVRLNWNENYKWYQKRNLFDKQYKEHHIPKNFTSRTVQEYLSKKMLLELSESYWKNTSTVVREYWTKNIMEHVPIWKQIGDDAIKEYAQALESSEFRHFLLN